ncbi:DUF3826 domain-containing protein [Pedobacter sp. SYSU D00535]|uniref:DUF3826 domain-containing protein n=1 Tax=Pedobacter sp. SYSU D00535 TaxID=2810308 RepID=UPI001A96F24A|nr:DUF3826 domain-containing protein [Pedobacter sp. SYSU D00535]
MKHANKLLLILFLQPWIFAFGQSSYRKVAEERADKIVSTLEISRKKDIAKVRDLIADQYESLNKLHSKRDEQLKTAGSDTAARGAIKRKIDVEVKGLHAKYIAALSKNLSPADVDRVKNGMTYNVVPLTYQNYLLQIPYLTREQKDKILAYLIEAREFAMDEGSSKDKHAWFGKYKGKITNYLASLGYDMKKESSDWAARRDTTSKALGNIKAAEIIKSQMFAGMKPLDREIIRNLIVYQYQKIEETSKARDAAMAAVKDTSIVGKNRQSAIWGEYKIALDQQRDRFVADLNGRVKPEQVEYIKDYMTGFGLKKEYDNFLALLPDLTEPQKKQVRDYLLEARDNAMNVLSEKEQHKWFIKYRGRTNNYLSKQGYNLRKATEDLEAKMKLAKEQGK